MTIRKGGIAVNHRDIVKFLYETDPITGECVCVGIQNGCEKKYWSELGGGGTTPTCFMLNKIECDEFAGEPNGGTVAQQCFNEGIAQCDEFEGEEAIRNVLCFPTSENSCGSFA